MESVERTHLIYNQYSTYVDITDKFRLLAHSLPALLISVLLSKFPVSLFNS